MGSRSVSVPVVVGVCVEVVVSIGFKVRVSMGVVVVVGVVDGVGFRVEIKVWVVVGSKLGSGWGPGSMWGLGLVSWYGSW